MERCPAGVFQDACIYCSDEGVRGPQFPSCVGGLVRCKLQGSFSLLFLSLSLSASPSRLLSLVLSDMTCCWACKPVTRAVACGVAICSAVWVCRVWEQAGVAVSGLVERWGTCLFPFSEGLWLGCLHFPARRRLSKNAAAFAANDWCDFAADNALAECTATVQPVWPHTAASNAPCPPLIHGSLAHSRSSKH